MTTTEIRQLNEADFEAFSTVMLNAYPSWQVPPAERQQMPERWLAQANDPTVGFYGAFRDGTLLGGMKLYDFSMTFGSAATGSETAQVQIPAYGVGMVGVDLLHKKEHVAREMIAFFLHHTRSRGAPLAMLYPFRPDFYKRMGFGYGTKMNEYRVSPASLPPGATREHLAYLTADDADALLDYYNRYQARTHGMIQRSSLDISRKLANGQSIFVGYRRDGQLRGYLQFTFNSFDKRNFLAYDLDVVECLYDSPDVLAELLEFLRTQADQVRHIVFHTQDEDFHHLLLDPRDDSDHMFAHVTHQSNAQGIGLMYRVVDTARFFHLLSTDGSHSFGDQTLRLTIALNDSFLPENAGETTLHFEHGRVNVIEQSAPPDANVRITLDVAEFSSLLMGVVSFQNLYAYGLAEISDATYVKQITHLFRTDTKPICMTAF